jgi:hypothetical protein
MHENVAYRGLDPALKIAILEWKIILAPIFSKAWRGHGEVSRRACRGIQPTVPERSGSL